MPRDGSGVYTTYSGTDGITNQPILSTPYNRNVHDIEADLNAPRPIVAGGTGASNATQARQNMQAERAMQVVTNYDSQVWEAGSFTSAVGATGSPDGASAATNVYAGTVEVIDGNNVVVEARNLTTGTMYMRKKVAGVWSGWTPDSGTSALDAYYVLKTGDAMSGPLAIAMAGPTISLNDTGQNGGAIWANRSGGTSTRWVMNMMSGGDGAGNAGADLTFIRFDNAGIGLGTPLTIQRSTGNVTLAQSLGVNGSITTSGTITAGNNISTTSATVFSLDMSASRNIAAGGNITATGGIQGLSVQGGTLISTGGIQGGTLSLTNSSAATSSTTGAAVVTGGIGVGQDSWFNANLTCNSFRMFTGAEYYTLSRDGGSGYATWAGLQTGFSGYMFWANASTSAIRLLMLQNNGTMTTRYGAGTVVCDASGNFSVSSDERLKNIFGPFTRGLEALRKIGGADVFQLKQEEETLPDQRYAGFVAQKVQRGIPEAVGVGHDGMLTLDDRPLIATLMNAVIELADKVEQLTLANKA